MPPAFTGRGLSLCPFIPKEGGRGSKDPSVGGCGFKGVREIWICREANNSDTTHTNNKPMTLNDQLKAVVAYNSAINQMTEQFPTFINGDRASDMVSDAIHNLNLPVNEDEETEVEVFWRVCEERGII